MTGHWTLAIALPIVLAASCASAGRHMESRPLQPCIEFQRSLDNKQAKPGQSEWRLSIRSFDRHFESVQVGWSSSKLLEHIGNEITSTGSIGVSISDDRIVVCYTGRNREISYHFDLDHGSVSRKRRLVFYATWEPPRDHE